MNQRDQSTIEKALSINLDTSIYGTFAEIGAGQEVARHFFQAGKASQTIAKTISAYDMTFSDSIYGKAGRYVCEERLDMMLSHEFNLLIERLGKARGSTSRFFALADTVATSSHDEPTARCHGWMGVRFQAWPNGETNQITVHLRMLDKTRLQQQEALGLLGVNLLHLAFNLPPNREDIVDRMIENIGLNRIEINVLRFSGPALAQINNRLMSLQLVKSGVTEAVVFNQSGGLENPSDVLFKRPIVVQRGTFRPVTNTNVEIMERGLVQVQSGLSSENPPQAFYELTMNGLGGSTQVSDDDFLERVDTLCALGHMVLLSNFHLYYQLKTFLRTYTDQKISMLIGASTLEKLFDSQYYSTLPGGILEGFSRLLDINSQLLVFPYKSASICQTAKTFHPGVELEKLYQHLLENGWIADILNCETVDTSIDSHVIRKMMAAGDSEWERLVPPQISELIQKRHLFGYSGRRSPPSR